MIILRKILTKARFFYVALAGRFFAERMYRKEINWHLLNAIAVLCG